ncbi:meteorin-like protein [Haliotis cracherodii]|uniref:meteorin-like protein n=1 Tax=Haliotis cracherodii TaxID=6455 RepID=UPI0039EBBD7D
MDISVLWRALASGHLVITWLLLTAITGGRTQHTCNQCDCTISDPGNGEGAIINVKPKCLEGQITWLSSYGAIRLELSPRHAGEYRYCVRVQSENIKTIVSQEVLSRTHGNYKLKIVNDVEVRLSPLFTTRGRSREFCISGSDPVRLYLETERSDEDTGVARVKVHYDIEKTSSSLHYSPMEECRPCTDRELLRAYCTSDFVAVGNMDDVDHDDVEETSVIRVSVTQLLSQKDAIFKKAENGWTRPHELKGVIHAPHRCGIRHGEGQFLFTGRVRLGQPMLQCAPRYEQWKSVLEMALLNDELECSYGS